jgi:hypothetical protein
LINDKQFVIDFLKTFGSSIQIHSFEEFNKQISLIQINESKNFKQIITSLQDSVTKIHNYLMNFKDITKLEINQDENLLSITLKMVNSYVNYEEILPSIKKVYEKSVKNLDTISLSPEFNFPQPKLFVKCMITLIPLLSQNIIQFSNNVQQLANNKQTVINLLKVIGSSIPFCDFKRYNKQVSSFSIYEEENFNTLMTSLQNSFLLIHEHLQKFKNKTQIVLNEDDNLLSISEKLVALFPPHEDTFQTMKKSYEDAFHNLFERTKPTEFSFPPHLFVGEMIKILPQFLEKISIFSHQHSILLTQVTQLKSSLDLERKQISQSLIVMNQQYERRINVMQTYFVSITYEPTNED